MSFEAAAAQDDQIAERSTSKFRIDCGASGGSLVEESSAPRSLMHPQVPKLNFSKVMSLGQN